MYYLILNFNIYGQGKTSATIDIRIKIVSSLSTSIAKKGFVSEINPNTDYPTINDREILVQYYNRVANNKNGLESQYGNNEYSLMILNSNNERIANTLLENSVSIKNLSKIDKLKFLPSENTFNKKNFVEPSITIIY